MKKEDNFYSGIKKTDKIPEEKSLGDVYKILIKPTFIIVAAICVAIMANFPKIKEFLNKSDNNDDGLLFLLFVFISIFSLCRGYQSLKLAKIDYSTLEKRKIDEVTFAAVYIFLTTPFLLSFLHSYNILFLYAIYALISLSVTVNFWHLFLVRFEEEEKNKLDYICEKRIQLFNATVFSIITILLFSIIILKVLTISSISIYVYIVIIICILLLLNIWHSYELTYIPKIILSNEKENDNSHDFKKIKICRMSKNKTKRLAINLVVEFSYVFEYIFETKDHKKLKRAVLSLLMSGFGFGKFGYMRFYSIEHEKEEVGWMKINSMHSCRIYKISETLSLISMIISQFRVDKLREIYIRVKEVADSQPKTQKNEFELTYFVIHKQHRADDRNKRKYYGFSAMNLLTKALLHSNTNNINCHKLILLVREPNQKAQTFFEKKIGFKQYEVKNTKPDPLEKKAGKALFFQYSTKDEHMTANT